VGFEPFLAADPSAADRDRIGAALLEFYVGTLYRHGLYNCDPHPGNYLFLPDGRVAMLDYGCTRSFDREFVRRLAALTQAVQSDDPPALRRAFESLGMVRKGFDFDDARDLIRSFYGPMLKDATGPMSADDTQPLGDLFKSKRRLMKLTLPAEFLFLFRIRFGLMSILGRLGARANWYRLERQLAEAA
jgi:predicted unusual protein kinase regulating ubiquinone biosynthesis (AarF/ABC1/UbiB family)